MTAAFSTHSPIDGTTVWHGEASTTDEIHAAIEQAAHAQRDWAVVDIDQRCAIMRRYAEYLRKHRQELASLLGREVGKLPIDADGEINASVAKVEHSIQALRDRRWSSRVDSHTESRVIRYRPLGVVVVLGPFNFPIHLPGAQIIPALLAGNAVVFKPSEQATALGVWMARAWHAAGLPEGVLQTIVGGRDVAATAVDSPLIGGVFLTGSRQAGLALRRQLVDRYDVLLAMELGGNNPIVVAPPADVETASGLVTHSAFISSGQRCSCARRALLIEDANTESLVDAIVRRASQLTLGMPHDKLAPDLGPLISANAADQIQSLYESLVDDGYQPLLAPVRDPTRPSLIGPAIVDASHLADDDFSELGNREWFGPLLVLRRVSDFDTALRNASSSAYGLSAALLGGDSEMFDRFVREVGAGVVNWNRGTTGAAGYQPFGGLGQSGNHRPAGYFAIDSCNDPVASIEAPELEAGDPWKPFA